MPKLRTEIFVRGLGDFWLLRKLPTLDTAFVDMGHLDKTTVADEWDPKEIRDEAGSLIDVIPTNETARFTVNLKQTSKAMIDVIRNARLQYHAMRYYGKASDQLLFQYFCSEFGKVVPAVGMDFQVGERQLPVGFAALEQKDQAIPIPLYFMWEGANILRIQNLSFFIDPMLTLNQATAYLLDISGWAGHGTLNSDFASIWDVSLTPSPTVCLLFDGVNDKSDHGDILDMDATADWLFEAWVRIPAANGTAQPIMGKRTDNSYASHNKGWTLWRHTDNKIRFSVDDNTNYYNTLTSTSTVLQNVWTHVSVGVDRNGNAQIFINGAADGAAVSIASIGDTSQALSFQLGSVGTVFGNVRLGPVRAYNLGAGNIPTDLGASIFALHYLAEKAKFGL